jgi:hypothetical protein
MATITAQAKLYTGIRCLCVDKNISAALTSSFSIGNYNRPSQPNNLFVLSSGALVQRIKRTVADVECVAGITLTDERYRTYGGGNVTNDGYFILGQSYKILQLNPGQTPPDIGTTNWNAVAGTTGVTYAAGDEITAANSGVTTGTGKAKLAAWTARSSVVCDFPTYIEIDVEKLGIPEGTDVILNFEEGWVLEDRGRRLPSGAWEYPTAIQGSPAPKQDNFVAFRIPKFGVGILTSAFSLPNTVLRIKQLASSVSSTATVIARGIYNPGKFAALFAGTFSTISFATKNTGILFVQAPYQIISTMITNGVRARLFNCNINSDSGVSIITLGSRVRRTPADLFLYTNVSSAGTRSASLVPTSISSNFTMNATPVKEVKTITTEAMTSSLTCKITLIVSSVTSNITATSTFEQNSDLVFTYYGQNFVGSPFVNAYYEGQFSSDATIFWGDGTSETVGNTGPNRSHAYPSLQEWTIRVRVPAGSVLKGFNAIDVNTAASIAGQCVRKIKTFGQIGIINLVEFGTNQLESAWIEELPDALPPTVRKLDNAFGNTQWYINWKGPRTISGGLTIPAKDHNLIGKRIQNWDVSKVTSFSNCFRDSAFGDGSGNKITYDEMDLRLWNTESATNMTGMFNRTDINQDLSGWCVPLIASTPSSFYVQSTTVNPLFQPPVWGTCP